MQKKKKLLKRQTKTILVVVFVLLSVVLLYQYNPISSGIYPKCVVYSVFSVYCPGCGTLRSLNHLLHGHIHEAIVSNILIYLSLLYFSVKLFISIYKEKKISLDFSAREINIMLVIIVFYTILRNIPIAPFNILAP